MRHLKNGGCRCLALKLLHMQNDRPAPDQRRRQENRRQIDPERRVRIVSRLVPSKFDSMSTVAAVLPSCHCGSVGSFTKAAEMMPVDFSGPAGRITSPTELDTLLRINRLPVSLARVNTGQKAVA